MQNKTLSAFITGGTKRLGKAMALFLAKKQYNIILHCRQKNEIAMDCVEQIQDYGVKCSIIEADLNNLSEVKKLIPHVQEQISSIDLLVNNASIFVNDSFETVTEDHLREHFTVNFYTPFFLSQAFASQASNHAMIINLLDCHIHQIKKTHVAYHLTKKCMYNLTLIMAKQLAPAIRVNAICPGPALPPPDKDEAYLHKIAKATPMQQISPPNTILASLDYLLQAKTVTGQIMYPASGDQLF